MTPQHAEAGDLVHLVLRTGTVVLGTYEGDDRKRCRLEGFTPLRWWQVKKFKVVEDQTALSDLL